MEIDELTMWYDRERAKPIMNAKKPVCPVPAAHVGSSKQSASAVQKISILTRHECLGA